MIEYFDVLDQHGNKLGKTQPKGSPMAPGEYYLGVHVYLYNPQKEFLMHQRSMNKSFRPGAWETVLEHTIAGETSAETAQRGMEEEMGLTIPLELFQQTPWVEIASYRKSHNHILHVYVMAYDFDMAQVTTPPAEVMAVKAFSFAEMIAHMENMTYRPPEYQEKLLGLLHQI